MFIIYLIGYITWGVPDYSSDLFNVKLSNMYDDQDNETHIGATCSHFPPL